MSFAVITDTSANIPTELLTKEAIRVIPFHYYIGGNAYTTLNTDDFDGDAFYQKIREGMDVTTSLISPATYAEYFENILKEGLDLLFIGMSSGISGSLNAARLAAQDLLDDYPGRVIEIIDTLGASLGEGIIALRAAAMRDAGIPIKEAAARLREHVTKMFQVFTVDDLMHLRKGGRLSNLSAIVGTVLKIKPLLKGDPAGRIVAFAKIRGRRHSVAALAEKYDQYVVHAEEQIVGIAQAGCRDDAAYLEELLKKHHPPKEILTVQYEPVTGAHVGPGALALFFEGGPEVRSAV